MNSKKLLRITGAVGSVLVSAVSSFAQGTAFTYQGKLGDGGLPASGTYDLVFAIYDSASEGGLMGGPVTNSPTAVSNGLFTVLLDFGAGAFPGANRWLEIGVRTNGSAADFVTLSPRQEITASPYAIMAGSVSAGAALTNSMLQGIITVDTTVSLTNGAGRTWNFLTASNGMTIATLNDVTNIAAGSGTVTSVGLSLPPALFNNPVDGSPITNHGSFAPALANQNAHTGLFGPPGGPPAPPAMRAMEMSDLPPLSNAVLVTSVGNLYTTNGTASGIPAVIQTWRTGTNSLIFLFGDDDGNSGELYINRNHAGTSADNPGFGEWQWTTPGSWAIGPGFGTKRGHIQLGIGTGNYWSYWQSCVDVRLIPNSLGYSGAQTWSAYLNSNGVFYGSFPGILGRGVSTNGQFELMFFSDILDDAWTINRALGNRTGGIYSGDYRGRRGWDLRGGLIQEKSTQIGNSSCALNFASSACVEISAQSDTMSFYVTNNTQSATDYEQRVFVIRAGFFSPAVTWPSGWNWLGPAPSNIASGDILRLRLESIGPGSANILAEAASGNDHGFAVDSDASSFFTRAGITDKLAKSAVNQLVRDLKANNLWSNFYPHGFIYPFAGPTSTNNAQNLVGSNYTITWHGAVGHTNGITGDGVTGYGDTGCTPNAVPGLDATNQLIYVYAATNHPPTSASTIIGTDATVNCGIQYGSSGGIAIWSDAGLGVGRAFRTFLAISSNGDGNIAVTRTNASFEVLCSGIYTGVAASASPALDNGDIFLLDANFASGSGTPASEYYSGTIKAAAFGNGMTTDNVLVFFGIMNTYQSSMRRLGFSQ